MEVKEGERMTGIEILNEVTQMPDGNGSLIGLYVIFGVLALAGCVYMIYCAIDALSDSIGVGAFLCGLAAVALILSMLCFTRIPSTAAERETIVYAKIDDSVPWSAVNDKYELIRQDGKIYQLRVREPEE